VPYPLAERQPSSRVATGQLRAALAAATLSVATPSCAGSAKRGNSELQWLGPTVLQVGVRFNLRSIFFRTSLQLIKMLMMRREGQKDLARLASSCARFPTVAEAFVLHLL
jgi:hypothetical protein